MVIGGFQKVSLIDYPGKISSVVFTFGCNFRCPYCHNKDLILNPNSLPTIPEKEVFDHLSKRKGLIDGVCITGGEPTLQEDLLEFVDKLLLEQYLVKIDTNGSRPDVLKRLFKRRLVNYVALDVKAPLDHRYAKSAGLKDFDDSFILRSMKELASSSVEYELRTTVVPGMHAEEDLLDLAKQLQKIAPKAKWVLQNFQPKNCLDPKFEKIKPYDKMFLEELLEKLKVCMPNVELRG